MIFDRKTYHGMCTFSFEPAGDEKDASQGTASSDVQSFGPFETIFYERTYVGRLYDQYVEKPIDDFVVKPMEDFIVKAIRRGSAFGKLFTATENGEPVRPMDRVKSAPSHRAVPRP